MVLFCEECGERYVIEQEDIKGPAVIFTCRVCNDTVRAVVPEPADCGTSGYPKAGSLSG